MPLDKLMTEIHGDDPKSVAAMLLVAKAQDMAKAAGLAEAVSASKTPPPKAETGMLFDKMLKERVDWNDPSSLAALMMVAKSIDLAKSARASKAEAPADTSFETPRD